MIRYLRSFYGMGFIGLLMAAAVLTLSGCGSSPPKQKGPAPDQALERFNRAARQAYDKGRLEQAANFYRRALERAYVRDDTAAILDAQYNLAVCLLNLNSHQEALDMVRRAKTEMALTDHGKSLDFLLLEATLLHRRGDLDQAWQITDQILSSQIEAASAIGSKTHFLRGLMASEQGDIAQLRAEIAALGQPEQSRLRADRQELVGRLAMAEQNWDTAIEALDLSATLRREAHEYRGMVRVVVLAGEASQKAGRTREAAIYYLRAGRSAFWQNQFDDARQWLNQSAQLANSAGEDHIIQEARSLLQQIDELDTASSGSHAEKASRVE
jgi:tetratricopeptide (TPR) repeat protein